MEDIEEFGIVREVFDSGVLLELGSTTGCKGCLLSGVCQKNGKKFKVKTNLNLVVGDEVKVEVSPKDRIFSSFIIFLVPIVFMIIFYFTGGLFFQNEDILVGISLLGLLVSGIFIKIIDKNAILQVLIKK